MEDRPSRDASLPAYRIIELLDVPHGAQVLEYLGAEPLAVALGRFRPDAFIYAVGEDSERLARMQDQLDERLTENVLPMLPGDIASLRGRIDRLLVVQALPRLSNEALRPLAECLAPGGWALFIDLDAGGDTSSEPPGADVYTSADARRKLRAVGLDPRAVGSFPYHYAYRCTVAER